MSDVPPATPRNFKIHYHMQLSINLIVIVRMKIWMCVCCASKSSATQKLRAVQGNVLSTVCFCKCPPLLHNLSRGGGNHLDNERFCQTIVRDSRHNHLREGGLGNGLFNRAQLRGRCWEHGHVWLALPNLHRHRGTGLRHILIHIQISSTASAQEVRWNHRLKVVASQGSRLMRLLANLGRRPRNLLIALWLVLVAVVRVVVNVGHLQLKTKIPSGDRT